MRRAILSIIVTSLMITLMTAPSFAYTDPDLIGLQNGTKIQLWQYRQNWRWVANQFNFGNPGDKALLGDFNGDNRSELVLKRGNLYFLASLTKTIGGSIYYPTLPTVYTQFYFGYSTDRAFTGDFDRDGRSELALQRGNLFFIADIHNNVPVVSNQFYHGNQGDRPFTGDFDMDGKSDLVLQRGNYFYFANVYPGRATVYGQYGFGNPGDRAFGGAYLRYWSDPVPPKLALQRGNLFFIAQSYGTWAQVTDQFYLGTTSDYAFSGNYTM